MATSTGSPTLDFLIRRRIGKEAVDCQFLLFVAKRNVWEIMNKKHRNGSFEKEQDQTLLQSLKFRLKAQLKSAMVLL